jgi:carboxyl-terminal processing protease
MRPGLPLLFASLACSSGCERAEVVAAFPDAYAGVGMELKKTSAGPVVVRTIDGGSAHEAGVRPGDLLVAVDGLPTDDKSLGDVVMRIRGKPDSQVTLTFERNGKRLITVVRRRKMLKTDQQYEQKN